MIRVLHILGGLGSGGAEALIMNWYRNIDRTKVQFDFLVRSDDSNYVDEIERMGGRIFRTASFPRHFIQNYKETDQVLQKKEWEVIHVHGNAAIYVLPLVLANKYGYKKVIMHSHSVSAQKSIYGLIHRLNRKRLPALSDVMLACSEDAGKWMFEGNNGYAVLKNGIEIEAFRFDAQKRKQIREQYNLQDCFVIGNVGRFSAPKNHERMLRIFKRIREKNSKAVLLLVGDGELFARIQTQAEELGIAKTVVFAGRQKDVGAFLSAMDVFVFPSLWEGLGNVLVEAQANGLQCVSSTEATVNEVQITARLHTVSLAETDEVWADTVLFGMGKDRECAYKEVADAGYDSREVARTLETIYCGVNGERYER